VDNNPTFTKNPDHWQNLVTFSMNHTKPLHEISGKPVRVFLRNPGDKNRGLKIIIHV